MSRAGTVLIRAAVRAASRLVLAPGVPIERQRRRAELAARLIRVPRGARVVPTAIGGVAGERIVPAGAALDAALLYLHGGGYAIGSARTCRALATALATRLGAPAFVPDYRLAPEHPHPAALEDALAAYGGLLDEGIRPARIAVAGDSAGGGLALALALAIRDRGLPAPAVIGFVCPWLDLSEDVAGRRAAAPREVTLTRPALGRWANAYVAGADPADSSISPLYGDLRGLPPLVLQQADDDLLAVDAERLAARADAADIELEHHRHRRLWHDFHVLVGVLPEADAAIAALGDALRVRLGPARRAPRVAIVGAGMSGLCMAAKLRAAGVEDFTVHEKATEVGGTWRENRYPGLTCDVPSRFYSYSFAPNPGWTHGFAPGPEIQGYFRRVADDLGLRRHIRFGSEVTSARWDGDRWRLRARDGHEDVADVLVTATGVLHHPRVPEIDGAERFGGALFHSARWEDDLELAGKRVALIGTGSTGVQITTALAGRTRRLLVFQRTAQWILPVPNRSYSPIARLAFRRLPALNRLAYRTYQTALELILGVAVVRDGWQRRMIATLCRLNLRLMIRDRELRRRLTPDYQPMCKRLIMSARFYPALQRDGVELVTDAIDHIEPRGIVTGDGTLHEADVIVIATGFDAHAYMRPMEIVGSGGTTLESAWANGPRAYRTVAMPDFPNLFMLMGPHSPVGNQSLVAVAESQADYVLRWVEQLWRGTVSAAHPSHEATDRFNAEMRRAIPRTVWASGCASWYIGSDGLPELWPWTPARHRAILREPVLDDFVIEHPATRRHEPELAPGAGAAPAGT